VLYSSYAFTPGDLAHVVAFLARPAARSITGQSIMVDGGLAQAIRNQGPGVAVTPKGT
jgi:NAD(P)-dependent dehydrogenase (short-subunit alcohol dehydrogenase family)